MLYGIGSGTRSGAGSGTGSVTGSGAGSDTYGLIFVWIGTARKGIPTGLVTLCEVSRPTSAADCSCGLRNYLL